MRLPEFHETHLTALVIAGRTLRRHDRAGQPENDTAGARGIPFAVLPNDDDVNGRVGVEIAGLLHQAGVSTRLLLSWELLQREGPVLPPGAYQPYFTEEGLEELFVKLVREQKPDLLFLGATSLSYRVGSVSGRNSRFSLEVESEPSLLKVFGSLALDECTIVRFGSAGALLPANSQEAAAQHICRGYAEFRTAQEGRLFARSGVMNSFDAQESFRTVRKH